jgi:hypothetical protein
MENYQTPEGVRVPKALQPYMMGKEFIPYNPEKVAAWNAKVNGEAADTGKKGGKGKNQKSAAVNQSTNKAKQPAAKKPAQIPTEAKKLFDECEAILKKSDFLNGANPTQRDVEMFK